MEIVATHANADFDALASQVAVSRLYPGTVRINQGSISRIVRDFLALHKDHFELTDLGDVDLGSVTKLILVDVRRGSRLKPLEALFKKTKSGAMSVDVEIYDHHDPAEDDIQGGLVVVENVGATTTLLVEALRKAGRHITPVEATLYALGVYSDTGSLTYPGTTPRDVEAAAFLLANGASLRTLRLFLHAPLGIEQRQIMAALLNRITLVEINGVKIGFGTVPLEKTEKGLSEIVNEVLNFEGHEALFAFFPVGKNVFVIGRSQVPYVDVGAILLRLGGGGHPGAGSVKLKNTNMGEAEARLRAMLEEYSPKPRLVRHMMSTPCHTAHHRTTLEDVDAEFVTTGISGAPVIREGKVVGVISRRDVRRARRKEDTHLSVSSYMSHNVKTVHPDVPIVRALEEMVAEDVGRLPVMENDMLVGIITRSDILKVLYAPR